MPSVEDIRLVMPELEKALKAHKSFEVLPQLSGNSIPVIFQGQIFYIKVTL